MKKDFRSLAAVIVAVVMVFGYVLTTEVRARGRVDGAKFETKCVSLLVGAERYGHKMTITDGMDHSYVIREDSSLWAWGRNRSRQLGDSTTTDRRPPASPTPAPPARFTYNVMNPTAGRVRLISRNTEYKPGQHFLHGATYTHHGLVNASGIPFELWLANNLTSLPKIQYSSDIQIVVEGEHGQIITFPRENPAYHEGLRQIGIPAEHFINGAANISLPNEFGTYLVYIDVTWYGVGNAFYRIRYVFKIVRAEGRVDWCRDYDCGG